MPIRRLRSFLDKNHVQYRVISHPPAYTGQEIVEAAGESGKEFAKTVILKIDDELVMVVIPADYKINLEHLEQELGVRHVELAHEKEFRNLFPDCEPGAMPPLGELYDIEVFIDESFADHEMISFNAGTHKEIIKMRYKDFQCLVGAKSINFLLVFTRE